MINHNELKKISNTHQANTIVYSDENGYISDWLNNDPVISSIKNQNEYIGSVQTAPAPDTQSILTQFVYDTAGRQPRNGDEVAIEDVGELWLFNGTQWLFFTNTTLSDASTTNKGIMQVGTGLNVNNGVVSVDDTIYWPARSTINNSETTPNLTSLQENTDYIFSNPLTSLTLGTIPNSPYFTTLTFTTDTLFTFTATNLTQWYFSDNPPDFLPNTTYKIIITNGKGELKYFGERIIPYATANTVGGVKLVWDSTNAILNIITE